MKIAIIPARGGSKRIKDKNIHNFCGQPLITYSLDAARQSGIFDEIHVSTDSEQIADVVRAAGFKIDFMRAPELADDHTPLMPVLKWVLETYHQKGRNFDEVCLLMPTAPLIDGDDLRNASRAFNQNGRRNNLLAVSKFPVPVEWAFDRDPKTGMLTPLQPEMHNVRSQDLKERFFDAGTFIFFNADSIFSGDRFSDQPAISFPLPQHKVVDIDTIEDLHLAEVLYRGMKSNE